MNKSAKQGKIKSAPITEPANGQYCLNKGLVCKIVDCSNLKSVKIETLKGGITSYHTLEELKQVFVEFEFASPKESPLKYLLWQDAVDNHLIDSGKTVTFGAENWTKNFEQ